jgi:hypothetical protein
MAPVLFLFLMFAFAKTLESKWRDAGIAVCTVRSVVGSKLAAGKGCVRGHLPKEYLSGQLTAVEIFQCFFLTTMLSFSPHTKTWLKDWHLSRSTLPGSALRCTLAKQGLHQKRSVFSSPPLLLQLQTPPLHCTKQQWV